MEARFHLTGGGDGPHPLSLPPDLNHVVLTGRLAKDPEEARDPSGERVTLLRVEFTVARPGRLREFWRWATCLAEVPTSRETPDVAELRGGSPVLIAGQLGDRWTIEGGHTSRYGVIVAAQVKVGPHGASPRKIL